MVPATLMILFVFVCLIHELKLRLNDNCDMDFANEELNGFSSAFKYFNAFACYEDLVNKGKIRYMCDVCEPAMT